MLRYPPKPEPGSRVAVLSPSAGLPARFPEVYEQGLRRLRDELGLEPVEYPTTRAPAASAAQRAADLHAAFADPSIAVVMASVGGDDQITVLPHLDAELLRAHPKPFFGYSDNTNLLLYLWNLGLVSYHGGSVMVHLGRPSGTHPVTMDSLRAALFTHDWYRLPEPDEFGDEPGCDWSDPSTLDNGPPMQPAPRWTWYRPDRVVEGTAWGGNVEILSWLLQVGRWIQDVDAYAGCVLLLETSEEMPAPPRCTGRCATWANAGYCDSSRRSSWVGPRPGNAPGRDPWRNERCTAPTSRRPCCARSRHTTPTPWSCSTQTSGTRTRS